MKRRNAFIAALAVASIALVACGGPTQKGEEKESEAPIVQMFEVEQLLAPADSIVGRVVRTNGVCTHVCQHGGRKMFLMGADDAQIIRIDANDDMPSFDNSCTNALVTVEGILSESRIDETYLREWEVSLAAETEEHHGEDEGGCSTEKKAQGENADTPEQRIADFRTRIAEREAAEGKAYLSFYHIVADAYEVE